MLDKLTKKQEQALPEFCEAWLYLVHYTGPMNKKKVKHWIREAYGAGGLKPPSKVVFVKDAMALVRKYRELVVPELTCRQAFARLLKEDLFLYGAHDALLSKMEFYLSGGCLPKGKLESVADYGHRPLVPGIEKVFPLIQLARHHCGWWLAFDELAIVSQMPSRRALLKMARKSGNRDVIERLKNK